MVDSVEPDDGKFPPKQRLMQYISRSNELIRAVYTESYKMPAFKDDGVLRNIMIAKAQELIRLGGVVFPREYTERQLLAKNRIGEISDQDLFVHMNLEEMIQQISKIQYEMDGSGFRKKTKSGQYEYKFPRRKDLAITFIYAIFMADVLVKAKQKMNAGTDKGYPSARG